MGSLELPFLAFLFALALVGYSIWDLDQLSGPGPSGHYSLAVARVAPTRPVLAAAGAMPGPGAAAVSPTVGAIAANAAAASATAAGATAAAVPTGIAQVPPASAPVDGTGVLAPWVATSCRIAMGITMAFMLVIMI